MCGEFLGIEGHCGGCEIPSWLAGAPQGFCLGFGGRFDCQCFRWPTCPRAVLQKKRDVMVSDSSTRTACDWFVSAVQVQVSVWMMWGQAEWHGPGLGQR